MNLTEELGKVNIINCMLFKIKCHLIGPNILLSTYTKNRMNLQIESEEDV